MRSIHVVLAATAALLAIVPLAWADPPSAAARGTRYAVGAIGDSLTDARSGGGKYLTYLRGKCPASRFDNWGKGGQMVNQMRRRFARDIIFGRGDPTHPRYSHVIVFGGVNDIGSNETAHRTPEKIERDLLAMYSEARQHQMKVVAVTIAPWGGFKKMFNDRRRDETLMVNRWIIAQRAASTVDYVIDAHAMLSCADPDSLCDEYVPPYRDGLHFNEQAHFKLGAEMYRQAFADCR